MRFKVRAHGYKVGATLGELMRGSVWPRRARVGHGSRMVKSQRLVESVSKAAEDCRTPRAGAGSQRPRDSRSSEHRPLACAPSGHSARFFRTLAAPRNSRSVLECGSLLPLSLPASKIRESVL